MQTRRTFRRQRVQPFHLKKVNAFLFPLRFEDDPVVFITSAHNRRATTEQSVKDLDTICSSRSGFRFLVIDSSDHRETLSFQPAHGCVISVHSDFFWSDSMRYAISLLSDAEWNKQTRIVFLNDDVKLDRGAAVRLLDCQRTLPDAPVMVGMVLDNTGRIRYGVKRSNRRWNRLSLTTVIPQTKQFLQGDTFNCNFASCYLNQILMVDAFPTVFRQAGGDYDLGFKLADAGVTLLSYHEPVGEDSSDDRTRTGAPWSAKNLPPRMWAYMVLRYSHPLLWIPLMMSPYLKVLIGVRHGQR